MCAQARAPLRHVRTGAGTSPARPSPTRGLYGVASPESNHVVDDGARPDCHARWLIEVELVKLNPGCPGQAQERFDELHVEQLPGAAAVAEAERRVSGGVAYGVGRAVDHAIDGAKYAVGQLRPAAVLDGERRRREGAAR